MKKGFTLTELIGVIILLAALSILLIPTVDKQLKEGKQKVYNQQIENIKLGAQNFYNSLPVKLDKNESMTIYLNQLKNEYIDGNISNPITKTAFPNDMRIEIKNEDGILSYHVLEDSGSVAGDFDANTPIISMNGTVLTYANLNEEGGYTDLGSTAHTTAGVTVPVITSNATINNANLGTYSVIYQATNGTRKSYAIRTVIVKDLEAPNIIFPDTAQTFHGIPTNEQLLSDVVVTDNSGEVITPTVETNFGALTGMYTIKYIAKDSSGNETVKLRNIIIASA